MVHECTGSVQARLLFLGGHLLVDHSTFDRCIHKNASNDVPGRILQRLRQQPHADARNPNAVRTTRARKTAPAAAPSPNKQKLETQYELVESTDSNRWLINSERNTQVRAPYGLFSRLLA